MRFEGDGDSPQAVSRNISTSGVLMATARELDVGHAVTLRFRVTLKDDEEHVIKGTIVRFEKNQEDPDSLWPFMVAVEFGQPTPVLEPLIEEAAQQAIDIA
jgi:hypothetical protein